VAATASLPARAVLAPGLATGPIARSPGRAPITPPAPWWAADASPLSPVRYDVASVFPQATQHGPPEATQHGPPVTDPVGTGTRGDIDLNTTLATPLARERDDADRTRPIPAVDETTPDAAVTDRTEVERTLANPTVVDPG